MKERIIITRVGSRTDRVLDRGGNWAVISRHLIKKLGSGVQSEDEDVENDRIGYRVNAYTHNDLGGIRNYLSTFLRTAIQQIFI